MALILMQFRQIAPFVVGIFFFLTGYGMKKSLLVKGSAYIEQFPYKRFLSIIPSFLSSIVLFQIILFVNGDANLTETWKELTIGKTSHLLPYSWFVIIVIIVYVLFYISSISNSCKKIQSIVFTTFIVLLYLIIRRLNFESYWYISLSPIIIGYYYAIYEKKINSKKTKNLITIIGLCSFLVVSLHWIFIEILMILIPIIVMYILESIGKINIKTLNFLGKISYELYLVHGIVIYILKNIPNFYVFTTLVILFSILTASTLRYFTKIQSYLK